MTTYTLFRLSDRQAQKELATQRRYMQRHRAELADTRKQLENARAELAAPFAREAELAEKTARLKELNILLNMDEKDKSLIDAAPEEDAPEKPGARRLER